MNEKREIRREEKLTKEQEGRKGGGVREGRKE